MTDVEVHGLSLAPLRRSHPDAPRRLLERDHTLWRDDPSEIADRLGWLDVVDRHTDAVAALVALSEECRRDGMTDAVVVGMGGSSLFPDVLRATFDGDGLALHVLDSTHPAAVRRALDLPSDRTLFVVASKSGTTIEPRSHLEALWADRAALDAPGRHFVAITDPGSELDAVATDRGFRAVLRNPADVGGRFSALTLFGLAPAGLAGVDPGTLLRRAGDELADLQQRGWDSAGGMLGLAIGAAVRAGRDKLVLVLPEPIAALGAWIEQLVAESLGKDGVTVVPVVGDPADALPGAADRLVVAVGDPRLDGAHVAMPPEGPEDLGALVMRWEVATALAGALLGVQPFDQPDVAAAKRATNEVLQRGPGDVALAPVARALEEVRTGDHLALTAFVDPGGDLPARLEACRAVLRDRLGVTTTLGIGPRYLHSTGQLHKGGGPAQVVVQVIEEPTVDVAIPGADHGFATLLRAQAEGDLAALAAAGRRAHRVELAELLAEAG